MILIIDKDNWKFLLSSIVEKSYKPTSNNDKEYLIEDVFYDLDILFKRENTHNTFSFIETNEKEKSFTINTMFVDNDFSKLLFPFLENLPLKNRISIELEDVIKEKFKFARNNEWVKASEKRQRELYLKEELKKYE
jgi:hypothetical protein